MNTLLGYSLGLLCRHKRSTIFSTVRAEFIRTEENTVQITAVGQKNPRKFLPTSRTEISLDEYIERPKNQIAEAEWALKKLGFFIKQPHTTTN